MNIEYLICEMFDDFCGSNLHRDQIVIRGVCSNVIDNLSTIIYVCFTDQISKKPSGYPPVSWLSHGWKIVFDEKFPNQTYIRLVWWFPHPSFAVNGFDQKPRKTTRKHGTLKIRNGFRKNQLPNRFSQVFAKWRCPKTGAFPNGWLISWQIHL